MSEGPAGISRLFEPRGVAVVGASPHPDKIGNRIVANILAGGYRGRVWPVNPKGGEILGVRAVASIEAIDGPVDVAAIVIPADRVHDAVVACGKKGIPYLLVITSGFSEVGNVAEERRIVAAAREHGVRVVGPNIFGFYSVSASLNASFGPRDIRPGRVAIVTQSGALGVAMIGKTAAEKIGLSAIVSVGNKADVDEADLLEYFQDHEGTGVILLYVEGVKDGEKLVRGLRAATARKPVVVIKSGRSKRGAVAAASHTGSLAGSDEIFDDVMRQCRVLRAETVKEALALCKLFASSPAPPGENSVIVTNAGGMGVLATDACEKYGVRLYDDHEELRRVFSPMMPAFGSTKNPIDLTGQASDKDYQGAFQAALADPQIHAVVGLYCETAMLDMGRCTPILVEADAAFRAGGKPLVFAMYGGERVEQGLAALRGAGASAFDEPYDAVQALGALFRHRAWAAEPAEPEVVPEIDAARISAVAAKARADGRRFLLAAEAAAVLDAAGIPRPKARIARRIDDAVGFATEIGFPVVLKVVSRDILHKSDAGGVALDLDNAQEVVDGFEAILANCRARAPKARIDGIEVCEMVAKGVETIVGARRDASFGPVAMFGLGGVYVEVMKDVTFRALPFGRREARGMLKGIKSYPLLLGVRGEAPRDRDTTVETILRVGAILERCPEISDLEVNPLVVYEQGRGARAVDARILLVEAAGGRAGSGG
ncbi:MAG: acetate--CoA ligase family protein [Deltaproteobacteria bacterium]|nr:acetate--CoA ligase family protein [Deltaproteobacteria bacterium]